MSRSMFQYMIT